MARKPRGQVRPGGGPGAQQQSQPPRPQGGGSWAPLRDAVRRDIEQAAAALAFATALHERLEGQRRLFADFPRVMEQLRSGALERVSAALSRLFEGRDQFDLTRFLRDLPLALAQLAAAEAARKGAPPHTAPDAETKSEATSTDPVAAQAPPAPTEDASSPSPSSPTETETSAPAAPEPTTSAAITAAAAPVQSTGTSESKPQSTNGGAAAEVPSPRLELRGRLLAAAPQLAKAIMTYRRTVTTVRRAAAPRRAPGPWRSDREVLEEARLAVDFARQLFDAYAEAWADHPTQAGVADAMSAETDRFLGWTQLARYVEVAAPRTQPPPVENVPESAGEKQPVTQGSAGAGGVPTEGEPAHG
jgi:hypothetical protein